jgi:hypothetical protein
MKKHARDKGGSELRARWRRGPQRRQTSGIRDQHVPASEGMRSRRRRPRGGRPPAGFGPGERVRDYPQLSVRIPPEIKLKLGALSTLQSRPQWRIVLESLECLIRSLSDSDQRTLKELIKPPR